MRFVTATKFQEKGFRAVVEETKKLIVKSPCYLTLDTDAIDCSEMPGTTLPEPFGLTGRGVRDFLCGISGFNLIGADIVELSPNYDPTGKSGCLAEGLGWEIICILAESRFRKTGKENKTSWL